MSGTNLIERAQPWLGTIVSLGVAGLSDAVAHQSIDAGFATVRRLHDLMSFHEPASDVSRLNCKAHLGPVEVDAHTYAVLSQAHQISAATAGVFDVTVGAMLAAWGFLPGAGAIPHGGTWRDIELIEPHAVRFHQPLWVDLGGIAKGYAVDCALQTLLAHGATQVRVNAGGDIRVAGSAAHRIMLRVPEHPKADVPVLEIADAALASSSNTTTKRQIGDRMVAPHLNGITSKAVGFDMFVSVVAETCMVADALTKVVLALGPEADRVLAQYQATAYMYAPQRGWQTIGTDV
ncbi:MAG: FAD:protein FMN transferase [Rhodospirillaceae bacterium]|nr:FAD:protein FMN transferase [Rhodospirillaceae bacterium]